MNENIFKQYDIRGIIGEQAAESDFYDIARGFASVLSKRSNDKRILIACDVRTHSEDIKTFFIRGLMESGFDVIDCGVTTTPMILSACHFKDINNACIITASHNPKEYNGVKFYVDKTQFFGENIQLIKQATLQKIFIDGTGSLTRIDIDDEYIKYIDKFTFSKDLKVAFDLSNGAACKIFEKLSKSLPFTTKLLFENQDGNFPNHSPDPSKKENLEPIQNFIKDNNYDIGFAFDGDADRVVVCMKNGRVLTGEEFLFVMAYNSLQKTKNQSFIADVLTSNIIIQAIQMLSGSVHLSKVGNGFIGQKMSEFNAKFGAEMSGHIRIADGYHGADDGIFAALYFLNIFQHSDVDEILKLIPQRYSTGIVKKKVAEEKKDDVINAIKQNLDNQKTHYTSIDGIRVDDDDFWFCIRRSNTEPHVMYILEAKTQEILVKKQRELEELFYT